MVHLCKLLPHFHLTGSMLDEVDYPANNDNRDESSWDNQLCTLGIECLRLEVIMFATLYQIDAYGTENWNKVELLTTTPSSIRCIR